MLAGKFARAPVTNGTTSPIAGPNAPHSRGLLALSAVSNSPVDKQACHQRLRHHTRDRREHRGAPGVLLRTRAGGTELEPARKSAAQRSLNPHNMPRGAEVWDAACQTVGLDAEVEAWLSAPSPRPQVFGSRPTPRPRAKVLTGHTASATIILYSGTPGRSSSPAK